MPTSVRTSTRWLALLAILLTVPVAWGAGFEVVNAATRLESGVYRLNARIQYRFSGAAREALQNGVPLTVALDMEVRRRRPLMWDETVYTLVQRYRLEYHTLSRQYLVRNLNSGERRAFPSRERALQDMGQITDFPMLDKGLLNPGEYYLGALRARLELDTLPTPLRLFAYISDEWRLASEWRLWPL